MPQRHEGTKLHKALFPAPYWRCSALTRAAALLLLCAGFSAAAQDTVTVTGQALDTARRPLPFAAVVLLSPADSSVRAHAITDNKGVFTIRGVRTGRYVLQIIYIGHEMATREIAVAGDAPVFSAGAITLPVKGYRLGEVKVEGEKAPFVFKDDTLEYHTGNVESKPNEVAEDLLKTLPGMDVERDGTVRAQGEEVKKVLVDGKEFFADDPKAALKNLPADAIENIQVFDDTGEEEKGGDPQKTLNFILKNDRREGRFGKASAGYGPGDAGLFQGEGRYDGYINYNRFDKDRQFTALGMTNNINRRGFSHIESSASLTGLGNLFGNGASPDNGVYRTAAGGLNFNRDFGKKTQLRSSYLYSYYRSTSEQNFTRRTFTDDEYFTTEEQSAESAADHRHRFNLKLEQDLGASQKIEWKAKADAGFREASDNSDTRNTDDAGILRSSAVTASGDDAEDLLLESDLEWRNEFAKKGRELRLEAGFAQRRDRSASLFSARSGVFLPDTSGTAVNDTIDQDQQSATTRTDYTARLAFDEPLDSNLELRLSYSYSNYSTLSDKEYYDITAGTQDAVLNPQLSDEYRNEYRYHRGGANLRLDIGKGQWDLGGDVQRSSLNGRLVTSGTSVRKDFVHFLPALRWKHTFGKGRKLRFRYSARVREPSLQQLQPATDNRDPFRLYIGNPGLKAEYGHYVRLNYIALHAASFRNYVLSVSGGYTLNKITNRVTVDSAYVQTTEPVNVDNERNLRTYFSLNMPLKKPGIKFNLRTDATWNRLPVFINAVENTTDRYSASFGGRVENGKKDKADVRAGVNLRKTLSFYSVSSGFDNDYLTATYFVDAELDFLKSWTLGSLFEYTTYGGSAYAGTDALPMWSASLSKYFLKGRKGELRLLVFDILGQNKIVSRTADLNYYQDQDATALGRFWMVSFIYNLAK